jgi:hypothetical protein
MDISALLAELDNSTDEERQVASFLLSRVKKRTQARTLSKMQVAMAAFLSFVQRSSQPASPDDD